MEVDRRIAAATAALAARSPGTPEHRAARVELATFLFARYTAAGDEADRAAIAATCRDVLADPGATARERQAVGLIQPVLTMLALFRPGAAPLPGADDLAGRDAGGGRAGRRGAGRRRAAVGGARGDGCGRPGSPG